MNRMALAWHCICGGGGLFSGSLDMLVVPSHMLPPSTNCTGRAKAGRAQDVLLESFSCPFMCPFGLARLQEGQGGEGQKMKGSLE